ncbi:MAG: hypothetical protein PHU43_03500 [Candidatus Bipolaricaulis sp.]|nr:hypothetical protein [Candidatus Bipolaricaulis sp.]
MSKEPLTANIQFSPDVIGEFLERIVKPYFKGDLHKAIEALMIKALQEEELLQKHKPAPEPNTL